MSLMVENDGAQGVSSEFMLLWRIVFLRFALREVVFSACQSYNYTAQFVSICKIITQCQFSNKFSVNSLLYISGLAGSSSVR